MKQRAVTALEPEITSTTRSQGQDALQGLNKLFGEAHAVRPLAQQPLELVIGLVAALAVTTMQFMANEPTDRERRVGRDSTLPGRSSRAMQLTQTSHVALRQNQPSRRNPMMSGERVLVTGGSGFLGGHCVARLLADGYRVSTTVRTTGRIDEVRAVLAAGGSARADDVHFVAADLTQDDGWDEAVAGADYVLHVASPFPPTAPAHEDHLIVPARDGALRVLRAARRAEVRRVVLTSSFAAIGYGHDPTDVPYDETSWTDPDAPGVTAYAKSRTLAERAAWDFVDQHDGLELAVVNPTGILGPALGPDHGTSLAVIANLLQGKMPLLPRAWAGVVDVRDIADLHIRAMTDESAAGQRFLGTAGLMSLPGMAATLKQGLGVEARRVSTRTIPDWMVRLAARFDDNARQAVPMIGRPHRATSAKAEQLLGWTPRTKEEAVLAAGRSILARAHH